ncbi:MAG: dehydrogenase [Bacteroidota bacterium]
MIKRETDTFKFSWQCWACLLFYVFGCNDPLPSENIDSQSLAATPEVAAYMEQFTGRGDQADDSQPVPPEEVLTQFRFPSDLALDLIAAEPMIHQPVEINFDHRGRLWVVQYSQYPFPAGLKIVGYDYHLRAQFDHMPDPPPQGIKGADKISILEDSNGDGKLDQITDAITGLNIATSVTWGRGKVWVLNPPYLLAFPDPDGDGIPNGPPRVHLRGFGLEDTHAVANSLRWGPDGWLYGAQGSTCVATISSSVSKNIHFKGQAIWRYHPETEVFEIYAEGGGNTFHVEIDDKGRIYSGHNGSGARGPYYKQGAYYPKNWGKHGALTNPYAFGFLPHMALEGEALRFTHAFLRYGGASLPEVYHDKLIGINPLHNFLQLSSFDPLGSTFKNNDLRRILETDDHWFRPVDIKAGPEGGIYIADWYDSRLSHIDPRDTWHRNSGRIYRLRSAGQSPPSLKMDISTSSNEELIDLLNHPNRWFRQQALRQLGDRKDHSLIPQLTTLMEQSSGQLALEALWAIHLTDGLRDSIASIGLRHADPYVRLWTVRLLGDRRTVSQAINTKVLDMASQATHPEVLSQLAASAKRFPAQLALPLIQVLSHNKACARDSEIPLQIWWALEDKSVSQRESVLALFSSPSFWKIPLIQNTILERLMQRYIMTGDQRNHQAAASLLHMAPDSGSIVRLMTGLTEGLRGRETIELPSELSIALETYWKQIGESSIAIGLRQGKAEALSQALIEVRTPQTSTSKRLAYIRILGETHPPPAAAVLLEMVGDHNNTAAVRQASLYALAGYNDPEIGNKIIDWYPDRLRADPDVKEAAQEVLGMRASWTKALLVDMDVRKHILPDDIPDNVVRQYRLHEDPDIQRLTSLLWPQIQEMTTANRQASLERMRSILKQQAGEEIPGKALFQGICGSCHQLFGEGGKIGPDLTGYERSNLSYLLAHTIDPSAEIREGYVQYRILTKDAQLFTGTIVSKSGGVIRVRSISGQEVDLPEEQLQHVQAQRTSLMPERLLEDLSDQELQDLFAYLMKENDL